MPPYNQDYINRANISNPAYEGAEEKTGNPLVTMAGEFLKFGIAMWAAKKFSIGTAGAIFKTIRAGNQALATRIIEGAAKPQLNLGGLFRGVAQAAKDPGFREVMDKPGTWLRTLTKTSEASMAMGRNIEDIQRSAATSRYYPIRQASKISGAFARAAPTALAFYALGRPLGLMGDRQDLPSWYNIPGHLGEITKLTGEFAAFDSAIAGGKIAYKGLKRGVENFAGKYLSASKSPGLHNFLDRSLGATLRGGGAEPGSFLKTVLNAAGRVQQAQTVAKTAGADVSRALRELWGRKMQRSYEGSPSDNLFSADFWKRTKDHAVSEGLSQYKSWTKMRTANEFNNPADFLNNMTTMLANYHHLSPNDIRKDPSILPKRGSDSTFQTLFDGKTGGYLSGLHDLIRKADKGVEDSFGGRVLGRRLATAKDIISDADKAYAPKLFKHLHEITYDKSAHKQLDNIQEAFYKMYAGKGIYKSQSGIIDYSMYSPRNLYKSAIDFATPFFTIPMGKGRELPILQVLGFNTIMARQGLAVRSFGMKEEQYYQGMADGHGWRSISSNEMGGGPSADAHGLAGVFLDGSLYTTYAGTKPLTRVAADEMKLIHAYPYGRYAQLHKIRADSMQGGVDVIKEAARYEHLLNMTPSKGFVHKALKFVDRMGIQPPSILMSMTRRIQDRFGIGPRTGIFRSMLDVMMNPMAAEHTDKRDLSMMLDNFIPMAENASRNVFFRLSDPKVLRRMSSLSKNMMKSQDAGASFDELATLLEKGGNDTEFMDLMSKNYNMRDSHEFKYAMDSFRHSNNFNLREGATIGTKFNAMQLNRKQELMRAYITDAMGMNLQVASEGGKSTFNLAEKMLDDPIMKYFGSSEKDSLRMIATASHLQQAGYIRQHLFTGEPVSTSAIWGKASKVISKHFKGQEQALLEYIQKSPMTKGQTGFKLDETWAQSEFDKSVRGIRSVYSRFHQGSESNVLLVKKKPDILLGINSLLDRTMGMSPWMGFKYGYEQRADNFIHMPNWLPMIGGKRYEVGGPLKTVAKRLTQGLGIMAAAQALDAFTDLNPLFAGTILDEGIFVGAAELGIKASLAFHKAKDLSGMTDTAKYFENLMPASTSTIPGAVLGAWMWGPAGIPVGMIANRFLSTFALPELDKSYDEMKDIYSGKEEVPIRKGRFWLFSKSNFAGDKVQYYRQHWFPRMKSQYKFTDTLYGSKAEAFLYKPWTGVGYNPFWLLPGVDKYHYEKKHYYDRPYAQSEPAFSEVPIIGSILGGTIGRLPIIGKPIRAMHQEEMQHYFSQSNNTESEFGETAQPSLPPPTAAENMLYMKGARNPNNLAAASIRELPQQILNPYGVGVMLGQQAYNFTEFAGLRGFTAQTVMENVIGSEHPFDNALRYSTPKEMWSTRRAWWDLNLGDLGNSEFFRRFIPREKKVWEKVNPLRNRMANWLPGEEASDEPFYLDFLHGDPFTRVQEGEIRLPGPAYASMHDVKHTFPYRSSGLGKPVGEIVRSMVGLTPPTEMEEEEVMEEGSLLHKQIQENLIAANVGLKSEVMIYDVKNDIIGHIDLIMKDFTQKSGIRPIEIKTVNAKRFAGLNKGPFLNHRAQLNEYIKLLQAGNIGTLLYVNRDDPEQIKTFDVRYSESLNRKDLLNVHKARQIAAGIIANGKGYEDGSSYSWMDRFRILSDVAPTSKEFKQAASIVISQRKAGLLSEDEIAEIQKIKKHRQAVLRKYSFHPYRFKNQVFNPDPAVQLYDQNEDLKQAAEYSFGERMLGRTWESFLHANTPLHTKLWNYRSPLEHYQRTRLYGSENSFWSRPWQDLVGPMYRQAAGADNPFDAATSMGWIGMVGFPFGIGSPLTAIGGAAAGMAYGAARWAIGDDVWVPEQVQKKREIDRLFDELRYDQAMNNYNLTGSQKYFAEAQDTMYSIRQRGGQANLGEVLKSMYYAEKPFIKAFIREQDQDTRDKIMKSVPSDVAMVLRNQWRSKNKGYSDGMLASHGRIEDDYFDNMPRTGWEGFGEGAELEDIKIKTIQNEGLVAQDFGLGWYDDQKRMARSPWASEPIDLDNPDVMQNPRNIDVSALRKVLESALRQFAFRPLVYIGYTPGGGDGVHVQMNITRDRVRELNEMIRGY